jgi:UDP-GlcNAc:undecaprenyl-phosphate GlcNAc-1-phosphate transferase
MPSSVLLQAAGGAFVGALVASAAAISASRTLGFVVGAKRIPALGGVAVILAWWGSALISGALHASAVGGLLLATLGIVIVGLRDIRRPLGPGPQFAAQVVVAGIAVLLGGVAVRYVTNPLGGLLRLDQWNVLGYALPGTLLTFIWIITLMNVTNFLDGMDGLAAGVGVIAFLAIGLVSLLPQVNDPPTALLAFIAAAALSAFLFWNLPPAALYLGTVGSWFIGFLLAVLAVQGASKVATVAVVGAVPLLDATAVVAGRLRRGQSPFRGDRTHLHHRLERRGLSTRAILLLYLIVSSVLGASAVLLQTRAKVAVFVVVSVLFGFLILLGSRVVRRQRSNT